MPELVMDGSKNMSKIVFHTPQFFPLIGGVENIAKDWAMALLEMGHDITVITHTSLNREDDFPFKVYRNIGLYAEYKIMRSADWVLQFNISLKAILPIVLSGKPLFVSHQSTLYLKNGKPAPWAWLKRLVTKNYVKQNIACSQFVADTLPVKTAVIPNPYNEHLFKYNPAISKKKQIIFVGRLVSDKGCLVLLEAIAKLHKQAQSIQTIIIGDGPEKDNLKFYCKEQEIKSLVKFTGAKQGVELVAALQESALMVVPSVWEEPFGIVALEGLACGCKLIVSNVGGLPDAAGNMSTSFPNGNASALAEIIVKKMEEPIETFNESVQMHLAKHTAKNTVEQLLTICKKKLSRV